MFRATLGSVAITVASGSCAGSAMGLMGVCPMSDLNAMKDNPDPSKLPALKAQICEAGDCKTALDKAQADCADNPMAAQFQQLVDMCSSDGSCMEVMMSAATDMVTCGITAASGQDKEEVSAARINKICDPSCKPKVDKMYECAVKMDQMSAEDASGIQLLQGMCASCVKEFMSVPKTTCGGQELPTKENVQKAECKEAYCAVRNACPMPSAVTESPLAAVSIGLDDYKQGMQTVIDNANCQAPTPAPAENDADSAYAAGVSMGVLVAAAAVTV